MALEFENHDGIGILYFNSPPANGLNVEIVDEFLEFLAQIHTKDVYSLVIASKVKDVFIAGADIRMIKRFMDGDNFERDLVRSTAQLQGAINDLEALPFPVIALISGYAMGGGLELALGCDFRFMAKGKARVGLPEVKLGLLPGAGGTQRLSQLIGKSRAKDIIYRSRFVDAQEALDLGIVDQIHNSDELMEKGIAFASEFKGRASVAIAVNKECINKSKDLPLKEGLALEIKGVERLVKTADTKEGVTAFLEKREPVFKGK